MHFRLRRRWLGVATLVASLLFGGPLLITWVNGQLTRQLLRDQSQVLASDPTRTWRMEIEELAGGWSATVCRLRLFDPRFNKLHLEVSGRLHHRLLTTRFAGDVYLLVRSQGPPREGPAGTQGFASFQGQARYQPVSGMEWSTRVQGQGIHVAMEGLSWTLQPWSAVMAGDGSARLTINLPLLTLQGKPIGTAAIRGAELKLENEGPAGPASRPPLRGHARFETLELRLPQGLVDVSGAALEGHIQREPDGWPFSLQLSAAELVYKGFPFTRVSALSYRLEGTARPLGSGRHAAASSGGSVVEWRSTHSLQGASEYGPMHADALASGIVGLNGVPSLSELRLTGRLPQGLWSVLQRLNAGLADNLVEAGVVHPEGKQVRLRAEYRGGQWRALAAGP